MAGYGFLDEIHLTDQQSSALLESYANGTLDSRRARRIPISLLETTSWLRVGGQDEDHVRALAEIEDSLPPILVHSATMRVIDGGHRVRATLRRGEDEIAAIFFEGTEDDAFLLAVRLNSQHGLPLTRADRTAAAAQLIKSRPHWSDRMIALTAGLSDKTVAAIRGANPDLPRVAGRIGHDGKVRPIDPAAGRVRAASLLKRKPKASLREIAREAGISTGTARDVKKRLRLGQDPVPQRHARGEGRRQIKQVVELDRGDHGEHHGQQGGEHGGGDQRVYQLAGRGPVDTLSTLRNDPSLRYSEAGRELLRLLAVHLNNPGNWGRMADAVPPHCADTVAQVARDCADAWQWFAEQINERSQRQIAEG